MNARALSAFLFAGLLLLSGSAFAQSPGAVRSDEAATLRGRHSLTFGLGVLSESQVAPGSVQSGGFLGSLSYTYWPHSEWGLELSASLLDSEAASGATASVSSLLIGASYYPEALVLSPALRPYLTGAVGPYIGSETDGLRASARTETVLGARLGAGIDAFAWRWLRLGVRAAYHATPNFGEVLGTIRDASGVQMSLEIGVALGGR